MLLCKQNSEPKAGERSFQVFLGLYSVLLHFLLSTLTASHTHNTINMQSWEVLQGPSKHTTRGNSLIGRPLVSVHQLCVHLVSIPRSPTVFPAPMSNHSTSLSSTIITILLSSELESDTFSKTFQITPLLGFSTKPFRANLCFVLVSINRLDVT